MTNSLLVYVVDDDPSVRRALERLLRLEGYRVQTFASGAEFLRVPDRDEPACVVLDIRMPGLSGFELLECLSTRRHALPVILITGHGELPMATHATRIGCVGFLAKPFEDVALLNAVREAFGQHVPPGR
ncbi:MAG TPA: response regulator [Vicinamibacterales bacterium]